MISVDDVKLMLKVKNITISLTDEELGNYINLMEKELCSILGISLDPVVHIYTIYFKNLFRHITLPLSSVVSIDSVKQDGCELPTDFYWVDLGNGLVHFYHPHKHWNTTLTIEYSTTLPDYLLDNIGSLLLDLVVDGLAPATSVDAKGVKSIKEGDVTVL